MSEFKDNVNKSSQATIHIAKIMIDEFSRTINSIQDTKVDIRRLEDLKLQLQQQYEYAI